MDICKNSDFMTPVTLVQDAILARTLTSDFWVDRALLPFIHNELEIARYPIKSRQNIITKRVGLGTGTFRWTVDAMRVFNTI